MSATRPVFPWIAIPRFAQPGQAHAFADREQKLAQLYRGIVSAGNAVRNHESGVRRRYVVSGYMGVGKSALILHTLAMLRDESGTIHGQGFKLPDGLPEPEDRQRWLILRASGKQVRSFEALGDSLQRSILEALEDVKDEAERAIPDALPKPFILKIPLIHRLFRTREAERFTGVRSALEHLTSQITHVREYQGGTETKNRGRTTKREAAGQAEMGVALRYGGGEGKEPIATAGASGSLSRSTASSASESIERRSVVSVQGVVDALNRFFRATDRAEVPTILVLDDFDEFVSNVGPSHDARFEVLSSVLGVFNQLTPTCLIIGLREEYMHEDVRRQFTVFHVPPMIRACADEALDAWAKVQQPPLAAAVVQALKDLGARFLQSFEAKDPVVIPDRFLQFITWLTNNAPEQLDDSNEQLVLQYLESEFTAEVVRIVRRVASVMPDEDIRSCAGAESLDPGPYKLNDREFQVLARAGLVRPAMAGDPEDRRIILDPLCAYLRAARP